MNELFSKKVRNSLAVGVIGAALYSVISACITALFYSTSVYEFAIFLTFAIIVSVLGYIGAAALVIYVSRQQNGVK